MLAISARNPKERILKPKARMRSALPWTNFSEESERADTETYCILGARRGARPISARNPKERILKLQTGVRIDAPSAPISARNPKERILKPLSAMYGLYPFSYFSEESERADTETLFPAPVLDDAADISARNPKERILKH